MTKLLAATVGLAFMLLATGCENIPYYDDTLSWFSWSKYDPEVEAIEAAIPPPGQLEAQPAAPDDESAFLRDARGGHVFADPPSGTVALGATPLLNRGTAGNVSVGRASPSADPPVGIRTSYGPSVTWRSPRGAP